MDLPNGLLERRGLSLFNFLTLGDCGNAPVDLGLKADVSMRDEEGKTLRRIARGCRDADK